MPIGGRGLHVSLTPDLDLIFTL